MNIIIISIAFFSPLTYFYFISAVLSDYESAEDSEVSVIDSFSLRCKSENVLMF
jgi:hypothetical protein